MPTSRQRSAYRNRATEVRKVNDAARRSCGKLVFSTYKKAVAYINQTRDRTEFSDALRAYRCQWCNKWHTTTK